MKRVLLQPAYILHRRSYRETSFLIEAFTKEFGRISLLAKGARRSKSSQQGILQPFIPVLISWVGNGELMTLINVESNGEAKRLEKESLFAGFYLNELIVALLHKWDAHPSLFTIYENALFSLQGRILEEKTLRSFEKALLEDLGYAFLPRPNSQATPSFLAEKIYRFVPEQGFIMLDHEVNISSHSSLFLGKNLLAITNEDWNDESLYDAKRLSRFIIGPLLSGKELHSRKLFMQPSRGEVNEE